MMSVAPDNWIQCKSKIELCVIFIVYLLYFVVEFIKTCKLNTREKKNYLWYLIKFEKNCF